MNAHLPSLIGVHLTPRYNRERRCFEFGDMRGGLAFTATVEEACQFQQDLDAAIAECVRDHEMLRSVEVADRDLGVAGVRQ